MGPFELFITYISWTSSASQESGGKNRPVLVLLLNEDTITVMKRFTTNRHKLTRMPQNFNIRYCRNNRNIF